MPSTVAMTTPQGNPVVGTGCGMTSVCVGSALADALEIPSLVGLVSCSEFSLGKGRMPEVFARFRGLAILSIVEICAAKCVPLS